MTPEEARKIWWKQREQNGDPTPGIDTIFDSAFAMGLNYERERCDDIIQAARFGEVDRDWRAISAMIQSGQSAEELKAEAAR